MQNTQLNDAVPGATESHSVDLRDYGRAIKRSWVTVVVCAVLGLAFAGIYAKASHKSYVATATVILPQGGQLSVGTPTPSVLAADMAGEQIVAASRPVALLAAPVLLGPNASQARLTKFLESVPSNLTVSSPIQSDSLQFSWKAGSGKAADAGANAFAAAYLDFKTSQLTDEQTALETRLQGTHNAKSLVNQIDALETKLRDPRTPASQLPGLSTQLGLLKVNEGQVEAQLNALPAAIGSELTASTPKRSGLSKVALGALGLLLGLLVGVAIAVVRDLRDHTVRDPEQLADELGTPVLAVVPGMRAGRSRRAWRRAAPRAGELATSPVFLASQPDGTAAQCFRALRSTLLARGLGTSHKVLLVVCADPVDSSSRLVTELGISIAESGRSVLLIGADLDDSALAPIFDVSSRSGLGDVLAGSAGIEEVVRSVQRCDGSSLPPFIAKILRVLPNGPSVVRSRSLLDSDRMVALLAEASATYDCVLLDCPSRDLLESLAPLARVVDAVLVVAGRERTELDVLRGMRQRVAQVGPRLIGAVLQLSGEGRPSGAPPGGRGAERTTAGPSKGATADGVVVAKPRKSGVVEARFGDVVARKQPGLRSGT